MNVFREPQYRFAAKFYSENDTAVPVGYYVSDAASNQLLIANEGGDVVGDVVGREFKQPEKMAFGKGGVYAVDRYNGCVRVFEFDGEGGWNHARSFGEDVLNQPVGIAIDPSSQRVYVANNENHNVAVFESDGRFVRTIGGPYGQGAGELFCPCGVALYKGLVIVAEWGNGRVQVFDEGGRSILVLGGFPHAHDVVVDERDGGVYVALYSSKRIRKFSIRVYEDGAPSFVVDGAERALECHPTGLFVEADGRLGVVSRAKIERVEF
jgi:DNA-binding beta-propeller fold protein YncE